MRTRLRSRASERFLIIVMSSVIWAGVGESRQPGETIGQTVRDQLLARINDDRARHGLGAVELDSEASRLADRYCRRQLEDGTRGHFSTDGLPPYMRYSFAGLEGYVLENVAAWSARSSFDPAHVVELALRSHAEMLAEVPPNDGHRRAILDPWVTHVGLGAAWAGGEVRIAELFLRRYLEWHRPDQNVRPGETVTYEAKWTGPAYAVEAVTVHYEPFPYRLSRERANLIDSYSLPPDSIRFGPERMPSRLEAAVRRARDPSPVFRIADGAVSFDVPFTERGVYTLVVWIRPPGSNRSVAATSLSVACDSR